jgi:hypothetical protein
MATFSFRQGLDRWLGFTSLGPDTVEEWVEQLTSGEHFTATTPEPVDLDGAPGFELDVELAEGQAEWVLFSEGWGEWLVSPGRPTRIWVVESPGGTVLITTDAPPGAFDAWTETVQEALSTLDWEE